MEGEGVGDGALQDDEILQINSKHIWILVARRRRKKKIEEKIKNWVDHRQRKWRGESPWTCPNEMCRFIFFLAPHTVTVCSYFNQNIQFKNTAVVDEWCPGARE